MRDARGSALNLLETILEEIPAYRMLLG
jgi:hypothetical protein